MEAAGMPWFELSAKKALLTLERLAPLLLIIFAALVILPGLGAGSLRDWDESIYAQVSREMIQSHDWIHLTHGYQPYFEKPPLFMWAIAIFYKLFGVSELWARMPAAISGILLVYVTYLSGREIYGNRTGLLSGLVLLSSYGFVLQARNGTTNMPLTLFFALGIWGYIRLRKGSQKWWYLIFASIALAFMVKFWAGLILPMVVAVVVLLEGRVRESLHSKHFWGGLLLAGLIVIPWHLILFLQDGRSFVNAYIIRNLFERTFTPLEGHYGSMLFYWDVIRQFFTPWYVLIPFGLAMAVKEIVDRQQKSNILLAEILLVVGIYTYLVNTKIDIYILPVLPALSILIAYLFIVSASAPASNEFINLVAGLLIASALIQDKLLLIGIILGTGLFILLKKGIWTRQQMPQVVTRLIFLIFMLAGVVGYVHGNNRLSIWKVYNTLPITPVSQVAAAAGQANPSTTEPLIGFDLEEPDQEPNVHVEGPAAIYYSNRPVTIETSWNGLEALMTRRGSGEILIGEKYLDHLSKDFDIVVVKTVSPLVYARFTKR